MKEKRRSSRDIFERKFGRGGGIHVLRRSEPTSPTIAKDAAMSSEIVEQMVALETHVNGIKSQLDLMHQHVSSSALMTEKVKLLEHHINNFRIEYHIVHEKLSQDENAIFILQNNAKQLGMRTSDAPVSADVAADLRLSSVEEKILDERKNDKFSVLGRVRKLEQLMKERMKSEDGVFFG